MSARLLGPRTPSSAFCRAGEGARATGKSIRGSILLALLLSASAIAADDDTIISPRSAKPGDTPASAATAGSLNSMSLLVGLALAGAGGWMVWRNRRGTPVTRGARALAVDETRSLGNRQYLVVASYEGRKFLLGVCPGRIDLLSPLDAAADAPPLGRSRE